MRLLAQSSRAKKARRSAAFGPQSGCGGGRRPSANGQSGSTPSVAAIVKRREQGRVSDGGGGRLNEARHDAVVETGTMDTTGVHPGRGSVRPRGLAARRRRPGRHADRVAVTATNGFRADDEADGQSLQDEHIGDKQRGRCLPVLPCPVGLLGHNPSKVKARPLTVNGTGRKERGGAVAKAAETHKSRRLIK